jgi:hypothetical protein
MTSLITDQVREFIANQGDPDRSGEIGGVVVTVALILLVIQSVLSATGKPAARTLWAITAPTAFLAAVVVAVRLEWLAS